MKQVLHRLNPLYKPPSRQRIAGPLLDKAYSKMKDKVDEYLDSFSELKVITDESSNINKAHITNISIHTLISLIHWLFEDLSSIQSLLVIIVEQLKGYLHALTYDNLKCINSYAMDIYPVMLSIWEYLCLKSSLRYLFLISCDLYGIHS